MVSVSHSVRSIIPSTLLKSLTHLLSIQLVWTLQSYEALVGAWLESQVARILLAVSDVLQWSIPIPIHMFHELRHLPACTL